jgi:iron complex outermembrane receptor protein
LYDRNSLNLAVQSYHHSLFSYNSAGDGSFYYRYPGNGIIESIRLEDGTLYSPLVKFLGGFTPGFTPGFTGEITVCQGGRRQIY